MSPASKLLLAAISAAVLSSLLAAGASARNLSQNEQRFRITFSPLSLIPTFGSETRCRVVLEGSLHSRTFTKVAEGLIGYVNAATFGPCESGTARANVETLPWHLTFDSFSGTLPAITGLTESLHNISFEINGEGIGLRIRCRYNVPRKRFGGNVARGWLTSMIPGTEWDQATTAGCPELRWSGIGSVTNPFLGSVIVTLI